jgi:hypothetical protein
MKTVVIGVERPNTHCAGNNGSQNAPVQVSHRTLLCGSKRIAGWTKNQVTPAKNKKSMSFFHGARGGRKTVMRNLPVSVDRSEPSTYNINWQNSITPNSMKFTQSPSPGVLLTIPSGRFTRLSVLYAATIHVKNRANCSVKHVKLNQTHPRDTPRDEPTRSSRRHCGINDINVKMMRTLLQSDWTGHADKLTFLPKGRHRPAL